MDDYEYYKCFFLVRGRSHYKRNSAEFLVEFQWLGKHTKFSLFNRLGWGPVFKRARVPDALRVLD